MTEWRSSQPTGLNQHRVIIVSDLQPLHIAPKHNFIEQFSGAVVSHPSTEGLEVPLSGGIRGKTGEQIGEQLVTVKT